MKKIIFIISITLLAFNSQAQGTLQFNQVITIVHDTALGYLGPGQSAQQTFNDYVVPPNKVAKINKAHFCWNGDENNSPTCGICFYPSNQLIVSGVTFNNWADAQGVWLKSGDSISVYIQQSVANYGGWFSNQQFESIVSLIEYNIIP
jgi:hypothetical protein